MQVRTSALAAATAPSLLLSCNYGAFVANVLISGQGRIIATSYCPIKIQLICGTGYTQNLCALKCGETYNFLVLKIKSPKSILSFS